MSTFGSHHIHLVNAKETFSLVHVTEDIAVYHSFVTVKEEQEDLLINLSAKDLEEAKQIVRSLSLDPSLLNKPLQQDPREFASTSQLMQASEMQEVMDVNVMSPLDASPLLPSAVPASLKKRLNVLFDTLCQLGCCKHIFWHYQLQASSTVFRPTAGPSSSAMAAPSLIQHLPSFFSQYHLDVTSDSTAISICLPVLILRRTTRSQIIFSIVTGLNLCSLTFPKSDSEEYYLFMELHVCYKWVMYNMMVLGWVEVTLIYNTALENKKGTCAICKTPRALMEKLEEVEKTIYFCLKHSDFTLRSGSIMFWKHHYHAVDLTVRGKHAEHVPPGNSENHKKGYCSDGVKQKAIDGVIEELPPWLQPNNIFTKGTHFWPKRFCRMIRELYDTITDGNTTGGIKAIEFVAFTDMLSVHLTVTPVTKTQASYVRFKLYHRLKLSKQPRNPSNIVKVNGIKYLHVTYLSNASFQ
ncbi:hypothetical protein LXA43DRAFT_1063210 [Ganoderma leucocontextum]|nr:hypothetical protein LXA43DRAFT_1063210 [Ganoderma leucocontextum]